MSSDVQVRHDPEEKQFYITADGGRAYLAYMDLGKQTLDMYRTFVPDELRGKGLAAKLAAAALEYAEEHSYQVIPSCSYIESYIKRKSPKVS